MSQQAFRAACERIDRRMRVRKAVTRETYGHPLHQYGSARDATVSYVGVAYLVQQIFLEPQYALERAARHRRRTWRRPGGSAAGAGERRR